VTTFGPVTQISIHGPFMLGPRSILKPDSFGDLSVHDRLIWLEETAVASRPLGARGRLPTGVGVGLETVVGVRVGVDVGRPVVGVRVGVVVGGAVVGVRVGVTVGAAGVGERVGVAVGGNAVGVRVAVAVGGIGVGVRVGLAWGVVALTTLENGEFPAALNAATR
jgi:hypothetical protein